VGALRVARLVVVSGDLGDGIRLMLLHRLRHTLVNALQSAWVRGAANGVDEQRVREGEPTAVVSRRVEHGGADGLVDCLEQVILASGAGGDGEIDFEDPTDYRGCRQDTARLGRQTIESTGHEVADRHRQSKLGCLAPRPAAIDVSDIAFVDQRPQHLKDEERISFRMPIEDWQQLLAQLLSVRGGREPLLELLARQTRQLDLVEPLVTR
jgi:hypothetical protein